MTVFFIFSIGSIFGSFFGVILDRFNSNESIIFGRSHCNVCGKKLAAWELIPIISQLILKSHCRHCKNKIPLTYLFLELVLGFVFLFAWLGIFDLPQFLLTVLSVLLSFFDYRDHSFPLIIWIFFALALLLTVPSVPFSFIWLILALLAARFDLKIGSGDFLWFFTASYALNFLQEILIIQIASLLGLVYYFLFKQRNEIAFIPFLTIAYLAWLLWVQIH